MKTQQLIQYREFDRKNNPAPSWFGIQGTDYGKLSAEIKQNGVTEPLELWVHDSKALLVEGNHRLAIAIDLGIEELPVIVKHITGDDRGESEYIERIKSKGFLFN